jgi:Tol biopolymer transport system component
MKNLVFTFLLFISINSLEAQSFTLENLMAAPVASNLTISPMSDKVVWVDMVKGVRNIYLATPPQYLPIKLTNFDKDDGIEISNLEWSLDEKTLYFIKGNAPQVRGTQPHNPSHVLEGTAPTIFQLDIENQRIVKIGNGSNPSISPNGEKMVFTRGGQIFIKNTSDALDATPLCQIRNGASQVRWSPDGQKLAFVSSRGTHSFVGVYDFEKKDYSFLDPSVDNDTEPIFSPDSKQVAFLRLRRNFEPNVSFFPIREQEPWSIVVADVTLLVRAAQFSLPTKAWAASIGIILANNNCFGQAQTTSFLLGKKQVGNNCTPFLQRVENLCHSLKAILKWTK